MLPTTSLPHSRLVGINKLATNPANQMKYLAENKIFPNNLIY